MKGLRTASIYPSGITPQVYNRQMTLVSLTDISHSIKLVSSG